jgi:hypothetical protein
MDTTEKILPQIVQVKEVEFTDKFEGSVTVVTIRGNLVSAYFWGDTFQEGEQVQVEFSALDYPISWEAIFSENREQKLGLEPASEKCAYYAYGKILSLNPIIADFGDIKLSIGEWTHDERVIGEYIYWKIDRLDVSRLRTT